MKKNITSVEIERVVAYKFGIRTNLIVPNISWGLGIHECDLLIVSKSGYCTEIEIKVSKSDLIKDKEKKHGHNSDKIKFLYFAIPDYLNTEEIISHIPEKAGILTIRDNGRRLVVLKEREPQKNIKAVKLTDQEMYQVARLGALRLWSLKDNIINQKHYINKLKDQVKDYEKKTGK